MFQAAAADAAMPICTEPELPKSATPPHEELTTDRPELARPQRRALEEKVKQVEEKLTQIEKSNGSPKEHSTELGGAPRRVHSREHIDNAQLRRDFERMRRLAGIFKSSHESAVRGDIGTEGSVERGKRRRRPKPSGGNDDHKFGPSPEPWILAEPARTTKMAAMEGGGRKKLRLVESTV